MKDVLLNVGQTLSAFLAIGIAIDFFLSKRARGAAYDRLSELWDLLGRLTVPQLAKSAAASVLRLFGVRGLNLASTLCGQSSSEHGKPASPTGFAWFIRQITWQTWGILVLVSLTLTSTMLVVGMMADFEIDAESAANILWTQPDITVLYLAPNLVFDVLTLSITLWLMFRITLTNQVAIVVYALIDLLLAIVLAVGVAVVTDAVLAWWTGGMRGESPVPGLLRTYMLFFTSFSSFLTSGYVLFFLHSSTTLIPTGLFLGILVVLLFLKPIGEAGRVFAVRVLGAIREQERGKLPIASMCSVVLAALFLILT